VALDLKSLLTHSAAMDLQQLVDALGGLGEEDAVNVMASVLKARPELAPPIVNFCCPDLTYPPSRVLAERRSTGTVKSFNHEKGFGFIECKELLEIFGNDVFLHYKQLNGFEPGTPVTFAVVLNKDNKPQAFDLALPDAKGMGDMKGGKGKACGKGFGKDMGKGFDWGGKGDWGGGYDMFEMKGKMGKAFGKGCDGKGGGKGNHKGPDIVEEMGTFVGTIKSFNQTKGYGFIDSPDIKAMGHQDVFLLHSQMGEFQIGDMVQFSCYLNSKNQPNARDLTAGGPMQKMGRLEY